MMGKVSAFILLLATLGYLTETVRMPYAMARMAEKLPCCKGMRQKDCPADAAKKSAPGKCNPDGSCNNTANCNDCPLCYTATPVNRFAVIVPYIHHSTHYPITDADMITGYHTPSWKPPDMGLFIPEYI
jgi:hypothetical protein